LRRPQSSRRREAACGASIKLQNKKDHHERSDCDTQSYLMSVGPNDAESLPSIICYRAPYLSARKFLSVFNPDRHERIA
jgi:hypothetical protein